ncbi:MAG: DUF4424 family protein, partial [Novosphingobium sp.]
RRVEGRSAFVAALKEGQFDMILADYSLPGFDGITALTLALPARANDSEAAVAMGGIELVANRHVSMDSEDLFISEREVRVRYVYTNHSDKDLELTISFPLPPVRAADWEAYSYTAIPDFSTLKFKTTVDGKPVKLAMMKRAEAGGRDVTKRIQQLGWPLDWVDTSGEVPDFVKKLQPAERKAYAAEGLLTTTKNGDAYPAWDVVTHVTRKQVFPARRSVVVTHRYAPMLGGSVAGALYPELRKEYPEHLKAYCIDKDFLAAFDRKFAARKRDPDAPLVYSETWIGYILSSGRNWRGPIKDFRLVVDKGKPENLVSFCMNGVKKISPTRFEVRRKNFEPKGDLEILIVKWPSSDE